MAHMRGSLWFGMVGGLIAQSCAVFAQVQPPPPQPEMAYVGRLLHEGVAVTEAVDFRLLWFNVPEGGSPLGRPIDFAGVGLVNGEFLLPIDLDGLDAGEIWLEVRLRTSGSTEEYVPLLPRQRIDTRGPRPFGTVAAIAADPLPAGALEMRPGQEVGTDWTLSPDGAIDAQPAQDATPDTFGDPIVLSDEELFFDYGDGDGDGDSSRGCGWQVVSGGLVTYCNVGIGAPASSLAQLNVWANSETRGVSAWNRKLTGITYALHGTALSPQGVGLAAFAAANTGVNFGIYAKTNSPQGWAGYFVGGRNYMQGKLGIGTTNPLAMLHVAGDARANSFTGSGTGLTNLNASNITSGELSNSRTTGDSSNTRNALVLRDGNGNFSAGTISATFSGNHSGTFSGSYSGDGSGLTSLNASNITSGRLGNQFTTGSSSNAPNTLVLRNGTGGFSAGTINATYFIGDGSGLTNLPVGNGTSSNTPDTLVLRDGSGGFSAGTINATFRGDGSGLTNVPFPYDASSNSTPNTLVLRDSTGSFLAGVIGASRFNGSGSGLTNLNASNINAGKLSNSHTSGDSSNTPNALVLRDDNGSFWTRDISARFITVDTVFADGSPYGVDATGTSDGVKGTTDSATGFGVRGRNTNGNGTGILGTGDNTSPIRLTDGSGLAGTADQWGVYGRATRSGNTQAGGYFKNGNDQYAYVAYTSSSGTNYKILGTGSVSTVMPTSRGDVSLVCPESPEAWFEDMGSGEIVDGVGHVELDPTFLECVTVDEDHPIMVFVQLTSPLGSQYYISKGTTGFDVIVDESPLGRLVAGGDDHRAVATFDFRVVAKWKGMEDFRFERAEGPLEEVQEGE